MSKPRSRWYTTAEKVLKAYPELYRQREQIRQQQTTAAYSGMPGGGGDPRKTEATATKQLKPREEADLEAVLATIQTVGRWRDGGLILRLVELVDWQKTHTIQGAADALHLSKSTAVRLRSRLIYELLRNMEY